VIPAPFTLSQLRAEINPAVFPASATTDQKNTLINKARELIYFSPIPEGAAQWYGLQAPVRILIVRQPYETGSDYRLATFTLPRGCQTVLGLYDCSGIRMVNNQWFDYLRAAPPSDLSLVGTQNWGCYGAITDMGDGWPGIRDIDPDTGALVKVTSESAEAGGKTLTFYGTDVDGEVISETINIPTVAGTSNTGASTFYTITQVVKSAATSGYTDIYLREAGVDFFYARYEPSEVSPNYRRYRYTGLQGWNVDDAIVEEDRFVNALCARRYVKLTGDNDPMEIESVVGMENLIRAYNWSANSDQSNYERALVTGLNFLNAELARFQPPSAYGTVPIDPAVGLGYVPNLV
jgi:hypothetical protein